MWEDLQTGEKLNIDLIRTLNENIKHPFLILDSSGNIVSFNKEAKHLFNLNSDEANIFDILDEESSRKLNEQLDELRSANHTINAIQNFTLRSKKILTLRLIINLYNDEREKLYFCTFKPEDHQLLISGNTQISFKTDNLEKIIKDEKVIDVIESVKSFFPFTFIGKEKLRFGINSLGNFFWIKDTSSKYLLVSEKFADALGMKAEQMEGKSEANFLPPYLVQLYASIARYIKDSHNCAVINGVPLQGLPASEQQQIVQIPLSDADNNVIAFIGFVQNDDDFGFKQFFKSAEQFLQTLPMPVVMIDNNGIIRNTSGEFCKLIQGEFEDYRDHSFEEILPVEISEKIKYFINSLVESEEYNLKVKLNQQERIDDYHFSLNRIYADEGIAAGLLLTIVKIESSDDLEKIINKRGRMFDILVKNNPEPIFIYDTDNLRFLEVNDSALALYGYRRDEFLQMDLTDLYTPEDIQTLLDSSNTSAGEGKFSGPYRHKKKDGSSVFVEISKINFKYNDSDAHFNIVRNITDKLELEKKNQLFKAAFDNTDDLLFITDPEGFITFINSAVKTVLNYDKKDLDNTSFAALVRNEERATINTTIFQSHFKETASLTIELKNSDGKFIEVDLTATPVMDYKSNVDSYIIVGKYKKEETIKEIVNEVIKEVIVEKPVPVQAANDQFAAPQFLSYIFHEILTPINVILGFVQELSSSIENLTPDQKEAVDIINENRSSLLNTMNTLAELSSIQKKEAEIKIEDISITEILDDLQNDVNEISESKGVDVAYGKISSSLKFESDKSRFKVLTSILLKIIPGLTKEKKIYFSSYQIDDNSFAVSIKDSYSSASQSLIDNLSQLIYGDGSRAKNFGISKLQLNYAKALLNLLGGKFEKFETSSKPDYAFIFPVSFSPAVESVNEPQPVVEPEPEDTLENIPEEIQEEVQEEIQEEIPEEEPRHSGYRPAEEFLAEAEEEEEAEQTESEPESESIKEMMVRTSEKLDLSQLNCLYIEDQVDSQILFKVQMKELKDIKFAVSFEEALPLLDSNHFDFIVMDINLQGEYNGLDALKIIHKMPGYENIPIIAVTAYVLPGDREKFIATGFNDFISKPIFREKMIDSLEKIFLMQL